MTSRETDPDLAAHVPTLPLCSATADDALDDWAALNALTFDSSLSFLDSIDGVSGKSQSSLPSAVVQSPPLLPVSDNDDIATTELLKDMLALAAEDDVIGDACTPVSLTPSIPPPLSAPQKSKSSMSRSRQKEEIEYLRVQMAELETELTFLKQRTDSETESKESAIAAVWEHIAKRQCDEKHRAEIENIKLRELLEGQLRVARSLEKLLRKRVLTDVDPLFVERKRLRGSSSPTLDLEDTAREIHTRILDQIHDVDNVLDQSGLSSTTTDREDVRATSDTANAICMEMTMVKTFPFAFADVAEAVWQCVSAERIELENGFYGTSQRADSLAELDFAVKLRVRRSEAVVHVRGVVAREATDDQARIVLESVGATAGPLFANQGLNCRERGYIRIEKTPTSSTSPSTIVRVCVRMYPESEGDVDTEARSDRMQSPLPQVGLFVDLVVGSYNQNVKTMLQAIENMLLTRSTHKKSLLHQ